MASSALMLMQKASKAKAATGFNNSAIKYSMKG